MTLYNEKKVSVYLIGNFKLILFITSLERKSKCQTNKILNNKKIIHKFIKKNEKHKNIKPRIQISGIIHLESCKHTNLTFIYSSVTRFQLFYMTFVLNLYYSYLKDKESFIYLLSYIFWSMVKK